MVELPGFAHRGRRAGARSHRLTYLDLSSRTRHEGLPMAKRIVVCSDGTGNTAIKGRGTNVFKLFEAVDLDSHRFDPAVTPQIAIYDDGVGTEDFKPLKLLGGATGWGLSRNVKHLYAELARVYDPGDEIYM